MTNGDLLTLAYAMDPALWAEESLGLQLDGWQSSLLRSDAARALVLVSRQAGKTLVAALRALHLMLFQPPALVLALCPAQRQSILLVRRVRHYFARCDDAPGVVRVGETHLELETGSRLIALPATESTVRGYDAVDLLLLDEAGRVPDELYYTVRPMLAVSQGKTLALGTPKGRRGWFFEAWRSAEEWQRVEVAGDRCPRFSAEFLARERAEMGPRWYAQEYECSFEADASCPFDLDAVRRAFTPKVQPLDLDPPAPARPAWLSCLTPAVAAALPGEES
jgi:hypothetical protein